MTRSQRLKALWTQIDSYVWNILVMLVVAATSAGLMNWFNSHQRAVLLDRFPIVRAQERMSCEKEYAAQITGLRALAAERDKREADQSKAMADLHELTAYISRFLGDRARVADRNAAVQLKEAKAAAAAAVDAKQKTEQVSAKVEVAVAKADEAASAVKQVDKKLETAVLPTAAVPPTPWIGNRR